MGIDVIDTTHFVFLKTGMFDESEGLDVNSIALKATSINVSVNRSVPNIPVPLSSLVRGEVLVISLLKFKDLLPIKQSKERIPELTLMMMLAQLKALI